MSRTIGGLKERKHFAMALLFSVWALAIFRNAVAKEDSPNFALSIETLVAAFEACDIGDKKTKTQAFKAEFENYLVCKLDKNPMGRIATEGMSFDRVIHVITETEFDQVGCPLPPFLGEGELTKATLHCVLEKFKENLPEGSHLVVSSSSIRRLLDRAINRFSRFRMDDIDLSSKDLADIDLSSTLITHCSFAQSNLVGANFSHATIVNSDFFNANLKAADFSDSQVRDTEFKLADMMGALFSRATFQNTDLSGAQFEVSKFRDINGIVGVEVDPNRLLLLAPFFELWRFDMSGKDLSGIDLLGRDLKRTQWKGVNLTAANLSGCIFGETDLSGAFLTDVNFSGLKRERELNIRGAQIDDASLTTLISAWHNIPSDYIDDQRHSRLMIDRSLLEQMIGLKLKLSYLDLSDQNLDGIKLVAQKMNNSRFHGATLRDAHLNRTSFVGSDFTSADLSDARLRKTNLSGCNFDEANLIQADLRAAQLKNASFINARTGGILISRSLPSPKENL
jgi:uncharacterized protein YjbI with pentapeptide repeats